MKLRKNLVSQKKSMLRASIRRSSEFWVLEDRDRSEIIAQATDTFQQHVVTFQARVILRENLRSMPPFISDFSKIGAARSSSSYINLQRGADLFRRRFFVLEYLLNVRAGQALKSEPA